MLPINRSDEGPHTDPGIPVDSDASPVRNQSTESPEWNGEYAPGKRVISKQDRDFGRRKKAMEEAQKFISSSGKLPSFRNSSVPHVTGSDGVIPDRSTGAVVDSEAQEHSNMYPDGETASEHQGTLNPLFKKDMVQSPSAVLGALTERIVSFKTVGNLSFISDFLETSKFSDFLLELFSFLDPTSSSKKIFHPINSTSILNQLHYFIFEATESEVNYFGSTNGILILWEVIRKVVSMPRKEPSGTKNQKTRDIKDQKAGEELERLIPLLCSLCYFALRYGKIPVGFSYDFLLGFVSVIVKSNDPTPIDQVVTCFEILLKPHSLKPIKGRDENHFHLLLPVFLMIFIKSYAVDRKTTLITEDLLYHLCDESGTLDFLYFWENTRGLLQCLKENLVEVGLATRPPSTRLSRNDGSFPSTVDDYLSLRRTEKGVKFFKGLMFKILVNAADDEHEKAENNVISLLQMIIDLNIPETVLDLCIKSSEIEPTITEGEEREWHDRIFDHCLDFLLSFSAFLLGGKQLRNLLDLRKLRENQRDFYPLLIRLLHDQTDKHLQCRSAVILSNVANDPRGQESLLSNNQELLKEILVTLEDNLELRLRGVLKKEGTDVIHPRHHTSALKSLAKSPTCVKLIMESRSWMVLIEEAIEQTEPKPPEGTDLNNCEVNGNTSDIFAFTNLLVVAEKGIYFYGGLSASSSNLVPFQGALKKLSPNITYYPEDLSELVYYLKELVQLQLSELNEMESDTSASDSSYIEAVQGQPLSAHVEKPLPESTQNEGHMMLSYSWSCNKALVLALHAKLVELGCDVWRDETGSKTTAKIARYLSRDIMNAIRRSGIVVICLSPEYLIEDGECSREFYFAHRILKKKLALVIMDEVYTQPLGLDNFVGYFMKDCVWHKLWETSHVEPTAKALTTLFKENWDTGTKIQSLVEPSLDSLPTTALKSERNPGPSKKKGVICRSVSSDEEDIDEEKFSAHDGDGDGEWCDDDNYDDFVDYGAAWKCLAPENSLTPIIFTQLIANYKLIRSSDLLHLKKHVLLYLAASLKPKFARKFKALLDLDDVSSRPQYSGKYTTAYVPPLQGTTTFHNVQTLNVYHSYTGARKMRANKIKVNRETPNSATISPTVKNKLG
jgi:hypothetical protein